MRRRSSVSIAANPVLIGAATTLVVLVAVFLAYNANSGLPFVPTYQLKANIPNAANLVVGNEVRIGGVRVGVVDEIVPVRGKDGTFSARLGFKLERSVKPLPVDSTFIVRPKSALGLKYVEITRGRSTEGFDEGATIPIRNATPEPVEFDQVLNMFDEPTRQASRQNLVNLGGTLAGRGADLNVAIGELRPTLDLLRPVARNLSDPDTRLGQLFDALGAAAGDVAPIAETQASLFVNLDRTFTALASVARPYLQDSISGGPPALDAAIRNFPQQRPFLRNSAAFFAELAPGTAALRRAAPDLADALEVGTPAIRRSVELSERLPATFEAVLRLQEDPLVALGVRGLRNTAEILSPTLAFLTPAQTVCNYPTLLFRNAASLLSQGDRNGTGQRFIIVATPSGPNNEGGPSAKPANGPNVDNFLHSNPYPNTAQPGGVRECEAGNEPFAVGRQQIGNVPGNQGVETVRTRLEDFLR